MSDAQVIPTSPKLQKYVVNGQSHWFPSDMSEDDVYSALQKEGTLKTGTEDIIAPLELWKGIGKSAANMGMNVLNVVPMITGGPKLQSLTPSNEFQNIAMKGTDVASMMLPWSKIGMAPKVVSLLEKLPGLKILAQQFPKLIPILTRAGMESAGTGAMTFAQTGNPEEAKRNALITGTMGVLSAPISMLMQKVGSKIQLSTIRPSLANYEDGFQPAILAKLGLKGNLYQSYLQVVAKLDKLRNARNVLIKTPGSYTVDIGAVLDATKIQLQDEIKALKHAGLSNNIEGAFTKISKDIRKQLNGSTKIDLTTAENAKESLGLLGAWTYGRTDLESTSLEKVANTIYPKLRKAIENALPQGSEILALNKQMQELIPIKNAMLSRIPVEERNRLFSLADITAMIPASLGGDLSSIALLGLTRGQKSLRIGNMMNNAGQSSTPFDIMTGLGKMTGMTLPTPKQ